MEADTLSIYQPIKRALKNASAFFPTRKMWNEGGKMHTGSENVKYIYIIFFIYTYMYMCREEISSTCIVVFVLDNYTHTM